MTAVYLGQAFCAPIMSAFLATEGGMATGWKFFGGIAAVGMVLIVLAISMSPMKKLQKSAVGA